MNSRQLNFKALVDKLATFPSIETYIAEEGTYGFYTGKALGTSRVVPIAYNQGEFTFAVNYAPSSRGNSYRAATLHSVKGITEEVLVALLTQPVPSWVGWGSEMPVYHTKESYLAVYNSSSKFQTYKDYLEGLEK